MKLTTRIVLLIISVLLALFGAAELLTSTYSRVSIPASVLGTVCGLILPGYLLLKALRIRTMSFGVASTYTVALSTAMLMGTGLVVNTILPLLGVHRPLTRPIVTGAVLACNSLLLMYIYRKEISLSLYISKPKISISGATLWLFPLLLTVLSVLGAVSLNNGGSSIISLTLMLIIGMYILIILVAHKRLPKGYMPYALFFICLVQLLMVSLRGWEISGHDILSEYYVAKLTDTNMRWNIGSFRDAYNACLSVSMLPTLVNRLLPVIPIQLVLRVIFQIIFSFTPVAVYYFCTHYIKPRYAFIATVFFITQSPLLRDFAYLTRQELAIFFYALILLSFRMSVLTKLQKNVLVGMMTFGLVLSHYSTTYMAIIVFILLSVWPEKIMRHLYNSIHRLIRRTLFRKNTSTSVHLKNELTNKRYNHLNRWLPSVKYVAILLAVTIMWNVVLTRTFNNLRRFSNSAVQSVNSTDQPKSNSIIDQLNPFKKNADSDKLVDQYSQKPGQNDTTTGDRYDETTYQDYQPSQDIRTSLTSKLNKNNTEALTVIGEVVKKSFKIFMLFGLIVLIFSGLGKVFIDVDYAKLILANFSVLAMALVLPAVSTDYDIMRAYQQLLIVLSLPCIIGGVIILRKLYKKNTFQYLSIFIIVYYLFLSPFIPQFVGLNQAHLQSNNYGLYYNLYYVHPTEIASINWYTDHRQSGIPLFADWYSTKKITTFAPQKIWVIDNVLPKNITKDSYVFVSDTNKTKGAAYVFYQGKETNYRFPTEFLYEQKDTIYSNGGSEILR